MQRLIPWLLVACLPSLALAADAQQILDTLAKAEEKHAEALRLEHAWSSTETLMDEARTALAQDALDEAEALAARALLTAEMAVKQAHSERDAWRERALGD